MMCASGHLAGEPTVPSVDSDIKLRERLAQASALLDDVGPAVLVLENTTFDLIFHNRPAKALLGRGLDVDLARNISDLLGGQWLEFVKSRVEEVANGARRQCDEITLPHPVSGQDGFFKFRWVPVATPRQPNLTGIGIVVEDLTEVRQSQEEYALFKVEAERNRISTELHDSLAHSLNGLLWQLRSLLFEIKGQPALENYASSLQLIESLGRDLHREFRRAVWALGTDVLRGRSLPDALRAELRTVTEILGLGSCFEVRGKWRALPEDVEQTAAKIFQESVHNVIKHAECSHIDVELEYGADCLRLLIEDDGKGFDPGSPSSPPGFGLRNMVSRAENMYGSVAVDSRPGQGTKVTVTVPTKRGWDGL